MTTEEEDDAIARITDHLDGKPDPKVAELIRNDADWQRLHGEILEMREDAKMISGLRKASAPATFTDDVTGVIEKRSAGRFFARRTLGDRVPFGALLVVALIALAIIGYMLWSSPTGSLHGEPEAPAHGSGSIAPTPE